MVTQAPRASHAPAAAPGTPTTLPLSTLQAGKYKPRTRMDAGSVYEQAARAVERSRNAASGLQRWLNLANPMAAAVEIRVKRRTKCGQAGAIAIALGSPDKLNRLREELGTGAV